MAQKRTYGDMITNSYADEATGFIHEVNEITVSPNNKKYFRCRLQSEKDVNTVVCFSPVKHSEFKNAQNLKTPVKLSNVKFSPGKKDIDILANHRTSITVTEVKFKRRLSLPSTTTEPKFITVTDLLKGDISFHDSHIVKGKVINIQDPKLVNIHGSAKNSQTITIHDGTDRITITLFEKLVGNVQLHNCYIFNNVAIRIYQQEKKLTTKIETTISPLEDEDIILPLGINLVEEAKNKTDMEQGKVISINAISKVVCPSCHKSIPNANTNSSLFIKCLNCNMKMRKANIQYTMSARIQIEFESSTETYTCFDHTIKEFLHIIDEQHVIKDSDSFEEILLSDKTFAFNVNMNEVTKIQMIE